MIARKQFALLAAALFLTMACEQAQPQSASGVKKIDAEVKTDAEGLTVEQRNVRDRLDSDNEPGSIKHLYIISAYSGDVLFYSTVRGKVTSSGKRLTPVTVAATDGHYVSSQHLGVPVEIAGKRHYTSEVLQDDGTYGSSIEYLYWWDEQGRYHQHYIAGGQIVHVSDQPIRVGKVLIDLNVN